MAASRGSKRTCDVCKNGRVSKSHICHETKKVEKTNAAEQLHRLMTGVILLATFCFFVTNGAVNQIASSLPVDKVILTYIMMGSAVLGVLMSIVIGISFDRLGRKRVTLFIIALDIISLMVRIISTYASVAIYAAAALVGSSHLLQVLLGWVGLIVCTPDARMKMAFGHAMGAHAAGMLAAYILQPYLMAYVGIRTVLAICACVMAVVFLTVSVVMPNDRLTLKASIDKLASSGLCPPSFWKACGALEWLIVLVLVDMPLVIFKRAFDSAGKTAYKLSDNENMIFIIVFLGLSVVAKFFVLPGMAQKKEVLMVRTQTTMMLVMLVGYGMLALAFDFTTVTASAGLLSFCVNFLIPVIVVHLIWSSNAKNWAEMGQAIALFFAVAQLTRLIAAPMTMVLVENLGLQSIACMGFVFTSLAIYMHAGLTGHAF